MALFRSAYRAEARRGFSCSPRSSSSRYQRGGRTPSPAERTTWSRLPLAGARNVLGEYLGLREDNARLRRELQAAHVSSWAPRRDSGFQNRDLSRMLEFREDQPVDLVPTRVIDRDFGTLPTTLVIDVGQEDFERVDQPVVTLDGLIGKAVTSVGRRAK